ncbi:C39 family peptidase [Paenibacillus marinisediminis]
MLLSSMESLFAAAAAIEEPDQNVPNMNHRYAVYQNSRYVRQMDSYSDAVNFAKQLTNGKIIHKNGTVVWESLSDQNRNSIMINIPNILQMPELPRGCEVTALAMLLQYAGVSVDKMELAKDIKRDTTPYEKVDGEVYFGNPYDGFVGDIYSFSNPGLGVFHGPIAELAEKYLPERVIDMTKMSFQDMLYPLSQGQPVWVIHNSLFDTVPESQWYTWNTPSGRLDITYKEHSVLITGVDDEYIYFNDPLDEQMKAKRDAFQRGWEQMGSQAITYVPQRTHKVESLFNQ